MCENLKLDRVVREVREAANEIRTEPHRWRIIEYQQHCVIYERDDGKLLFVPMEMN